jgi:AraC-like DNA-binding protein
MGDRGAIAWASAGGGHHLIPPDGAMDAILRWRPDGSLFETFVATPGLGAFSVPLDPRDRHVGLRLPPPLGFLLLGPPESFIDGLRPPWLDALGRRALGDPRRSPALVTRDLAQLLLARELVETPETRRVDLARRALLAGLTPGAALDAAGWPDRTARRAFATVVGVPPRFLASVIRMDRAARLAALGTLPLAHLALEAGFADQPHMGRSLRALTGLPAGQALAILAERYKTMPWDRI